jgi:hypothetical protein
MNHPEKPSVKLKLDGVDYKLVYDFDAIAEAEEILDRPLITGLRGRDIATPTISLVRSMFFATAHATHPELTFEQVKALVTPKTIADIWVKVLEAWQRAQPDAADEAKESANPQ